MSGCTSESNNQSVFTFETSHKKIDFITHPKNVYPFLRSMCPGMMGDIFIQNDREEAIYFGEINTDGYTCVPDFLQI